MEKINTSNSGRDMKILYVSRNFPNKLRPYEGPWALLQSEAFKKSGADIRVLSPNVFSYSKLKNYDNLKYFFNRPHRWKQNNIQVYGPKIFYWKNGRRFRHTYAKQTYLGIRRYLIELHKRWPFDLVFTQAIDPDAISALLLKKDLPILACGYIIGEAEVKSKMINDRVKKNVTEALHELDIVAAVSESVARSAEELIGKRRKVQVLYRGVLIGSHVVNSEIETYWRKRLELSGHDKVIMFVGHLYKEKGIFDLLNAFDSVAKNKKNVKLIYVGGGEDGKALKQMIEEMSLESRVKLTGPLKPDTVASLMNISSFICSPSYHEGLAQVNIEAGIMKKPVIGSNVGGTPEIVLNDFNGLLFDEPGNIEQLSNRIRLLLNDENLVRRLGENGYKHVISNFNAIENNKVMLSHFSEALQNAHIASTV
jgi:glycosyltransferase involved in cell wall biosynthesis